MTCIIILKTTRPRCPQVKLHLALPTPKKTEASCLLERDQETNYQLHRSSVSHIFRELLTNWSGFGRGVRTKDIYIYIDYEGLPRHTLICSSLCKATLHELPVVVHQTQSYGTSLRKLLATGTNLEAMLLDEVCGSRRSSIPKKSNVLVRPEEPFCVKQSVANGFVKTLVTRC